MVVRGSVMHGEWINFTISLVFYAVQVMIFR